MKKAGLRPIWTPAALVLVFMIAGKVVYNLPWHELAPKMHQPVVFTAAIILNLSLIFGASPVYALARFRGASIRFAVGAALLTPLVWNIWEVIRVTEFFTPAVSLFYGLNSMFLGAIFFSVFQIGVWEAVIRRRVHREKGLAGPLALAAAGLITVYFMLFRAMGAHWFYMYGKIYQALFH